MKPSTKKKNTRVVRISRTNPDPGYIAEAAQLLRTGELVAFPTETVYGLGADGLNETAIRKIFHVKNRPPDNPLILHIGYKKDIERYGRNVPAAAKKLVRAFWPGPLTVIVRKKKNIPDIVTGGLDTVAVRMPDNKIALALIRKAGLPVAAPSANVSGKPSPTKASHVYSDLYGKIELIIDGGTTDVGLESTIIDCSVDPPVILRPGRITRRRLERVIGIVENNLYNYQPVPVKPKSPGLKYRHYAPDATIVLVEGEPPEIKKTIAALIRQYRVSMKRIGILGFYPGHTYPIRKPESYVCLGVNASRASKHLYDTLRNFDRAGFDVIIVEGFPSDDHAIMNRLRKAASEIIIARG